MTTGGLSQVACPSCRAGNRVPAGRDVNAARCGQCGAPLFNGAPIDVDDAGLRDHLKYTKGLIVLDVWAPWCGPCRMMAPHFTRAAQAFSGDAVFLKMNADECSAPAQLGVRGIPALFLFQDGQKIDHRAGLMTAEALSEWLRSAQKTRRSA